MAPNRALVWTASWILSFAFWATTTAARLFDPEGFNVAAEQAIFWTRAQIECGGDGPEESRRQDGIHLQDAADGREDHVLFVHGSPRGPTNEYVFPEDTQNPKKMEKLFSLVTHLCFQGHTHVPGVFTRDLRFVRPVDTGDGFDVASSEKYLVNVGSVGQPRDGDPRSCYVVYDGEKIEYRRVELRHRKNGQADRGRTGPR